MCIRDSLFGGAGAVGRALSSTIADFSLTLPVQMRIAPTLSFVNNYGLVELNVAGRTATNAALQGSSVNSAWFSATTSGITSGNMMFVLANGIGFSAEL